MSDHFKLKHDCAGSHACGFMFDKKATAVKRTQVVLPFVKLVTSRNKSILHVLLSNPETGKNGKQYSTIEHVYLHPLHI